jgi:Ser/Thr protein kinase RdoA (MazF antagonist)
MGSKIMIPEQAEILAAFSCDSSVTIRPLGQGNINTTFLVETHPEPFVLQKLSGDVFPDPPAVIKNFEIICQHLAGKTSSLRAGFVMAEPVYAKDNSICFVDSRSGYWRAQQYLPAPCILRIDSTEQARSVGRTLARFHSLFYDIPEGLMKDPLPGFHHLSSYLSEYDHTSGQRCERGDVATDFCRQVITQYREQAFGIERARAQKEVFLQTIHGDPKVDNFIFSATNEAVGLLDLDTVGLGIVYHDLGDCLRSVCSIMTESAEDSQMAGFNLSLCQATLEGYFSCEQPAEVCLEHHYIYEGLLAICFELGLRFFTDHLRGNVYFRVRHDGENLVRAKNQLALCEDIVRQEGAIRSCIASLWEKYN